MAAHVVKPSAYGVTFATRQQAASRVVKVPTADEIEPDFGDIKAASASFVDGLLGGLPGRVVRVEITGLASKLEQLVVSIVERRDLSSRCRFPAAA